MNIAEHLCCFAVRQVVGDGAEAAVLLLGDRLSDRGQALHRALLRSNENAWRALEVALAGEGLFAWFGRADDRALREQMRRFIDSVPLPDEMTKRPRLRSHILAEIRDARKNKVLTASLQPEAMAKEVGAFARYSDPQALIEAEKAQLKDMARAMQKAGYEKLAWLLSQPAHAGDSVVVAAARYYFRREVERDEGLAHTLQLTALDGLAESQQASFAGIEQALAEQQLRLDEALGALTSQMLEAIGEMEGRLGAQIEEVKALQAQVLELINKLDMKQPLRASHSLSIHNERERAAVKEMLRRFRALPPQEQGAHPELMSDLGKLQVAAGDFAGARETFVSAAAAAPTDAARAEAHHNAFRAALEQRDLEQALREVMQAVALDPERFAPYPVEDYEAVRILGAGGFGVTFLCRDRISKGHVAIKSLFTEDMERDAAQVMEEATALDGIRHHGIIALRRCGYADRRSMRRPYLVMEYFPGGTLEEHVKEKGPLSPEAAAELATRIAEALEAAHGVNILHRDIKPANILLRREGGGWEVRVIDFGLAVKQERLERAAGTFGQGRTVLGASIAGTLGYAAPEQMGRLPGVRVGPASDVYGFGKTLSFALFGITEPGLQHYRRLPERLAELLSRCMGHTPQERPRGFTEVLAELRRCLARREPAPPAVPIPPTPVLAPLRPAAEPVHVAELASGVEEAPPPRPRRAPKQDDPPPRRQHINFASRLIHALLAFFPITGLLGVHKFAQGNDGAGKTRLWICLTIIGIYSNLFIAWIEAVVYLTRNDEDYYHVYYREKKAWF
jgi:serine/threonine protein kinase